MSEQFIDTSSDEFVDAPKALRDAYDRLKSRYTEAVQERDTYKVQATSATLGDALKEFKNPKRVQADLTSDGIDPFDKTAVEKWLESNGGDYAKAEGSTQSQTPAPDHTADAAAQAAINNSGGLRQPADMSALEAALAEAGPDATGAELKAIYAKHGV